jgi:hypothetical protein
MSSKGLKLAKVLVLNPTSRAPSLNIKALVAGAAATYPGVAAAATSP